MRALFLEQLGHVGTVSREFTDEVVAFAETRKEAIEPAVQAYISEQTCTEKDWPSPARASTRNRNSVDSGTERQQRKRRGGKQAGTGFGPPKDKKGSKRRKKGDPGMSISREDIGRRQGASSHNADSRSGQDDLWSRLRSEVLRYFPSPFGDGSRGGAAGMGGGAGGVARPVLRLGPGR
ncbi:MAG: hypothetical protein M1815_001279 [Lichina confinis]|nr:MAG: hypothetical protein M1815_001279 [Lichina confinis]